MYLRGSTLEPTCERTRGSRVGECHLGIDRPPRSAQSRCILTWCAPYSSSSPWITFSCLEMAGTEPPSYKRGLTPPRFTTHTITSSLSPSLLLPIILRLVELGYNFFLVSASHSRGRRAILDIWYGFVLNLSVIYSQYRVYP